MDGPLHPDKDSKPDLCRRKEKDNMTTLPMTAQNSLYLEKSTTNGGTASGSPDVVPRNSIQPAVCPYQGNNYNTGAQVCMNLSGQGIWAVCDAHGGWTLTAAPCALPGAAAAAA